MQGSTEQHQLNLISQLCGSISGEVWPGVENLPLFSTMELPRNHKRKVKERLKPYVRDPHACDLIDKMLTLDPSKRMGGLLKRLYLSIIVFYEYKGWKDCLKLIFFYCWGMMTY